MGITDKITGRIKKAAGDLTDDAVAAPRGPPGGAQGRGEGRARRRAREGRPQGRRGRGPRAKDLTTSVRGIPRSSPATPPSAPRISRRARAPRRRASTTTSPTTTTRPRGTRTTTTDRWFPVPCAGSSGNGGARGRECQRSSNRSMLRCPSTPPTTQWTRFEELPRFIDGVDEVQELDETHLLWRASLRRHQRRVDLRGRRAAPAGADRLAQHLGRHARRRAELPAARRRR